MKKKLIRVITSDVSFELTKGQFKFLSKDFDVIAVSSPGFRLQEVGEEEGIRTKAIEIKRHISVINDVKSLVLLYRFFKKEKPDIVHSMTPKAGLLSMMAAFFAQVPIRIHTFTGLIFPTKTGVFKRIIITMDQILCLCATKIIPEGNGVKSDLIKFNITKKPLQLVANGNINGVKIDYFNPNLFTEQDKLELKTKLNIKDTDFVYVFAGRLVGDKGINELIEAFTKLHQEFNNIKLLLLGDYEEVYDPLKSDTLFQIKNDKNIISEGWVDDVRPYFAISNALAFPSYREGFPNVVLQAGAMELPCIVTDINGCNEIISEGDNGTIIPVKSADALYEAMKHMYKLPKEAHAQMGTTSRAMIVSKFEQQFVWNALLEEYQKLLNHS